MSDDLFLEQKKFISVSRASKETGYTSDYIGQLCRQKKIPAKLVGRIWFVDIDALGKHKENKSLEKKQKAKNNFVTSSQQLKNNIANKEYLGQTRLISDDRKFSYEHEAILKMPQIRKVPTEWPEVAMPVRKLKVKSLGLAGGFLALVLWTAALFGNGQAIQLAKSVVSGIADVPLKVRDFVLAQVAQIDLNKSSSTSQGIVIMNESPDHNAQVEQVKNNFSDEVTVIFDQDSESGVIQPIFRAGTQGDNYAFVLVPLKQKK